MPDISEDYAFVTLIDGKYKNKNITLYRLKTGESEVIKVKGRDLNKNPIEVGSIIKTLECSEEKKWGKLPDGEYYQKDDTEIILKKWNIVN